MRSESTSHEMGDQVLQIGGLERRNGTSHDAMKDDSVHLCKPDL